ncbi:hypothetical protein R6Q57_021360 [Mikania cordata]
MSNRRDARRRIEELTSELENIKSQLSKTKIHADKYEYASTAVANMIDVQCRRKEKIGLSFTKVKPSFNHNYSIMPNINTSVDDLLMSTNDDDDVLESVSSSLKRVNRAHSTINKEADSKLKPNCEPFVPTGSLEQASTSTSSGHGNRDTTSLRNIVWIMEPKQVKSLQLTTFLPLVKIR